MVKNGTKYKIKLKKLEVKSSNVIWYGFWARMNWFIFEFIKNNLCK